MKKTTCPKCGHELRLTDWREECPRCGVNMTHYNKEELLLRDADRAEIEFALFQPRIDRAKASLVGSPAAVFRLICSLLPVSALFLPLAKLQYTPVLEEKSVTYQLKTVIEVIKYRQWDRSFGALPGALPIALLMLGALLCLVAHLAGIPGGCTKKGKIFLFAADGSAILLAICGIWLTSSFTENMCAALPQYIKSFSTGCGAYVFVGLIVLCLTADLITAIKGIPVKHTKRYIADIPAEEYFAAHPECIIK